MHVADQQLLPGGTLKVALFDGNENPAVGLTITVEVLHGDGSPCKAAGTAAPESTADPGVYTVALAVTDAPNLDLLTATWKQGSTVRATTTHEVVSRFYFTAVEAQAAEDKRLGKIADFDIRALRAEVEAECERICGVAFVPRYRRVWVDGNGSDRLLFPDPMVRAVRSVRTYTSATDFTSFSVAELGALNVNEAGIVKRADWNAWASGTRNLLVEYEHGYDRPPADLKRAAIRRCRSRLSTAAGAVPDRAMSFTAQNGETYRLAMPGASATGDPEVDAVYARYSWHSPLFA